MDFHCEHCGRLIKAPANSGGRRGKCPHCGGMAYIPAENEDAGELPLAPLDPEEERQRNRAMREAAQTYHHLLQDQTTPGEKGARGGVRPVERASEGAARLSAKALNRMVVEYVEAMAEGRLGDAEALAARLSKYKSQVLAGLEAMAGEDLAGYGLPALPRPVLLGFLRQLRMDL